MNSVLRYSKVFFRKNASTILTCIGGAGVIATSVMAVKATPKALQKIDEAKIDKGESLTKLEVIKIAGPTYIPAIVTGVATITCIFGANVLNKRQQAALISAYALLDGSYKEYKKKVTELYGNEAESQIRAEMAKDRYEELDEVFEEDDKQLFYDQFSERYFESTMEKVVKAEYEINRKLSLWGGADLNEFYELLDIPPVDYGRHLGWSAGGLLDMTWNEWLDFNHEKVVLDDGLECYVVSMSVDPLFDYEYY